MSLASERVYSAPREWVHVHPVSPLLGGWAAFAGVVGLWFYNGPAKPDPGQPRTYHCRAPRVWWFWDSPDCTRSTVLDRTLG